MKLQISVKQTKGKRNLAGAFTAGFVQVVFDSQTKEIREKIAESNKKAILTTFEAADDATFVPKTSLKNEAAKDKNEAAKAQTKEVPKNDIRFRLPISRNDLAVLNQRGFLAQTKRQGKRSEIVLDSGFAVEFWANPTGHSILNVAFLQQNKAIHVISKAISDSKHNLFLNINEFETAEKKTVNGFEVVQILPK